MSIRWMTPDTCSHYNAQVCATCDFDRYYANNYPGCPWAIEGQKESE